MNKKNTYPSLHSHRKYSVLTIECQNVIFAIGKSLETNSLQRLQTNAFRESVKHICPSSMPRAADEIRDIAKFYGYSAPKQHSYIANRFKSLWDKRKKTTSTPKVVPESGWIFIFHGDGFIREASLSSIIDCPQSPFEFTAIVYRLNDWVKNVRDEAIKYANLKFSQTSSEHIAESAFFLIEQTEYLVRMDKAGRQVLEKELFRTDVLEILKNKFIETRPGRIGFILSQLLKRPDFDNYLEEIALNATLPHVRAIAFDALINKRAKWSIGYEKQWVDKVYNISRRVRTYKTRKITNSIDVDALLEKAALDRSSIVRKVAARSLFSISSQGNEDFLKIVGILTKDKTPSVRLSAEYYLQNKIE